MPKSLTKWIGDDDLSLEVRIKRVAFTITMLMVALLGGAMLLLALIDIPAEQNKSHQNSVNFIGEALTTDIQNQFDIIEHLSNSSLVWTALTDSSGREAYLRPFLLDQEKNSHIPMELFDYRARPVLGMAPESGDANLLGAAISKVIANNKSKYLIVADNGQPYLIALFPIIFPHTKEPIGALVGKINLSELFQRRSVGMDSDLGLNLTYQKSIIASYHEKATTIYFPAQFDISIVKSDEGDTLKLKLYATQNPWLIPIAVRLFLSVTLAMLLGALVWRVSGALAYRLSRRLSSLADSCLTTSAGTNVNIPIDSAKDEIGVLSRKLHQTINAYDQINAHLEELVKEKTSELSESESYLRAIIEHEPECIKILDAQGRLKKINPAGLAMIEADSLEQVVSKPILDVIAPEYRAAFDKMHQRVIAGEAAQMEFEVIGLKNGRRWLETHAVPMQDHGEIVHLAVSRDITERKLMEEQVRQLAFYDPLTQLPNRRMLNDRLSQSMSAGKRNGLHGALIFLDLDNFKPINDTYGHGVGDLLLIEAANRLKSCVREMDTVARFGGDEFVVMLSELKKDNAESNAQASLVAEKIRVTLSQPYLLTVKHEDQDDTIVEHHCTASIGVVVFIGQEVSQDNLIEKADAAMYQAKESGRNQVRFYGADA